MSKTQSKPSAHSYTDYLHLFVLAGFAFAQPLYEVLGRNPEFFSVHRAEPIQIVSIILILSAGIGLFLALTEFATQIFGNKLRRIVHNVQVFLLIALIVAAPAKWWMVYSDLIAGAFVMTVALISTVAYARLNFIRLFMTALSPAILIFPLLFVFNTPVMGLVLPGKKAELAEVQIANSVPVVLVVFDEFSLTSILDSNGSIDAGRFPNLNSIASESFWFPNAVTVSQATTEAVPSILTGRFPRPEERLMPNLNDYPDNLFTLLGGSYSMNVLESVTSLSGQKDTVLHTLAPLLYDIAVIYLHLVVPPQLSEQLPQLDGRWTGFGQSLISGDMDTKATSTGHRKINKAGQLEVFLSEIESTSSSQLHFIHTLLPHMPHQYLASGQRYSMSSTAPDGLISDADGWADKESLLITAYHRYIQQLGYVDSFLGDLRDKLKSAGIYDKSLVVITADHGVSYQIGQSRRKANEFNANEILNIPLLVKLPGQKEGIISERFVSSADILPTIIDVLKADVPWKLDGHSVFSEKEPSHSGIEIPRAGFFSKETLFGRNRLGWQIENFGEHTSLNQLIPKGPNHELAGRNINNIRIGKSVDMVISSSDFMSLEDVDKSGNFLPALIKGRIKGSSIEVLPLAIAVNGTIWATTQTSRWRGQRNYFSVLMPSAALTEGRNIIKAYLIESSKGETILRPFKDGRLNISLEGGTLVFPDGKEVLVETKRNNMNGYSDKITLQDNMFTFWGWAADLVDNQPASDILVFKGEKLVWQVAPSRKRNGVVKKYGHPELLRSGYHTIVPLTVLVSGSGTISLIALSDDRRAFRIKIKPADMYLILEAIAK